METFIANLKHAIRNRETVTIGGGKFSTAELKAVADALVAAQTQMPVVADALLNLYNRSVQQLDQSATHDGLSNCDVLAHARAALETVGLSPMEEHKPSVATPRPGR